MADPIYRTIYIAAYGPIPKGWLIHHINMNHEDNRPENLVALPRGIHNMYHRLQRWLDRFPDIKKKISNGMATR